MEKLICELLPKEKVILSEDKDTEQTAQPSEKTDAQSLSRINVKTGLRYSGKDPEIYREVLEAYLSQKERYDVEMRAAYEEKDWKKYAILVHSLKSTSLSVGAEQLSEEAAKLEKAAKGEDEEFLLKNGQQLFAEYKEVLGEITILLEKG